MPDPECGYCQECLDAITFPGQQQEKPCPEDCNEHYDHQQCNSTTRSGCHLSNITTTMASSSVITYSTIIHGFLPVPCIATMSIKNEMDMVDEQNQAIPVDSFNLDNMKKILLMFKKQTIQASHEIEKTIQRCITAESECSKLQNLLNDSVGS